MIRYLLFNYRLAVDRDKPLDLQEKLSQNFRIFLKNILDSRMKLSLGMGQAGDVIFLDPSAPVSHYSLHHLVTIRNCD